MSLTFLYMTILTPLGFLEAARAAGADRYLQLRNSFRIPPEDTQNLLLVTIDDESQRHLNQKWPWDRALFAEFLRRIAPSSPRLVLLDFAFLGKSQPESDRALAEAIQEGPPTLIAAYLDPKGELMLPESPFVQAGGIPGLINKPLDADHVIRRMWTAVKFPGQPGPLYGIEVLAAAQMERIPIQQIRREDSHLILGSRRVPLGALGELPINYLASPEALPTLSFWKILQGLVQPTQIKDKLIIVGSTREITHDVHSTPLGRMPGMAIEANGILTLLTGRFLKQVPLWATLPAALLLVIGILQVTYRMTLPVGLLASATGVGLSLLGGFLLVGKDFSTGWVGPFSLGAGAWLTGFIYKYLNLLAGTLRLQRRAITDSLTGVFTSRYFRIRLQEEFRRLRQARLPAAVLLVQVASPSQQLQSQPWEETKGRMQKIADCLRDLSGAKGLVGRLQEDRFGVFLPKVQFPKAQQLAEKLKGLLRSLPGECALGLASTEQAPLRSGEDLIRCAEKALARAHAKGPYALESYLPSLDQAPPSREGEPLSDQRPSHLEYISSELEERNRALEKALAELRQAHQQLESAFLEVTKSLVMALETKDAYTAGHLERVSRYSTRLAEVLNLPREQTEAIREAALLHDIGKIGLPDEILHKVGSLTEEEREIIKQHLSLGAKILEPMKFFRSITALIYHHHERYDGEGYPHGLAGDLIPAGAQVIAIADAFDAMTTHRGYNKPMSPQEALAELKKGSGSQFNPLYVEKFVEVVTREGPQLASYAAT